MRHAARHDSGDAIQQALREAAGKMPEGVMPNAVLVCINSLYCNDGLVGETVTKQDGRWLPAPSHLFLSLPCAGWSWRSYSFYYLYFYHSSRSFSYYCYYTYSN